jgi:hypothetical protein
MRLMKCQLAEGSVSFGEFSKPLGRGAIVDLDEVVGHRTVDGTSEPVLLEELLVGDPGLLHAFDPIEAPEA